MKRTTIVGLNRIKFLTCIKENGILLTISFIFILGIFTGTMLFRFLPSIDLLSKSAFESFLHIRKEGAFFKIFLFSFLACILYSGVVYISGTSVVGTVLAPCIVFIKGFVCGIICAYLYTKFLLTGIAFNVIVFIPCNIISIFSLILFSKEATNFSFLLARLFTPKGTTVSIYTDFKKYCSKFLIYLFLFALSSLVDAAMSVLLIGYFNF